MAIELSAEARAAFRDNGTVKALASADTKGVPHLAFKDSLRLRADGLIEYREYIESSATNRNMTAAIWFGIPVSVALLAPDKRSFLIRGNVVRAIIAGREFRRHYEDIRRRPGDFDLSTVWLIEPEHERENTLAKRKAEEEQAHPLLRHVDRLLTEKIRERASIYWAKSLKK
ncbi:MAG: hypothetical protein LBB66_07010 [Desulfovibrio sp.]|jgi:hypothetical protein|nr:hypothetical protein [Desulfovibrio sp.]